MRRRCSSTCRVATTSTHCCINTSPPRSSLTRLRPQCPRPAILRRRWPHARRCSELMPTWTTSSGHSSAQLPQQQQPQPHKAAVSPACVSWLNEPHRHSCPKTVTGYIYTPAAGPRPPLRSPTSTNFSIRHCRSVGTAGATAALDRPRNVETTGARVSVRPPQYFPTFLRAVP